MCNHQMAPRSASQLSSELRFESAWIDPERQTLPYLAAAIKTLISPFVLEFRPPLHQPLSALSLRPFSSGSHIVALLESPSNYVLFLIARQRTFRRPLPTIGLKHHYRACVIGIALS